MPGLIAILTDPGAPGSADALERMLAPLTSSGHGTARVLLPDWGVAMGYAGPSQRAVLQPGRAADGQVAVLVEGEPLETDTLAERLGLPTSTSPADTIAALYARQGAEALTMLRGHWSLAVADSRQRQVVFANDAFGVRPLFRLRAHDGAWLIASSPTALLAYPGVTRAVNPAGLVDFLAFGYAVGSKTLFQGVELLPGATLLTWRDGELQTRRYWRLEPRPVRTLDEQDLENVRTAFNESVGRLIRAGGQPLGLALSGGLDSRAVLSAMLVNGASPQTITHSVPGAHDAQYGAATAQAAGVPHQFLEVRGEDLVAHVEASVTSLDGQAALLDIHPVSLLPEFARLSPIWFTGVAGDLLQRGRIFMVQTPSQGQSLPTLKQWALDRHNRMIRVDVDFPVLLSPDWLAEWQEQPARSQEEAFATMDPTLPLSEMSCLYYLEELTRKLGTKGDPMVRTKIETRHPYLDRDVLEQGFRLPLSARANCTPHRFIITRNAPALADIPLTRTGLPPGRYPFTRQERWTARLNRTPWRTMGYPFALWDRLEARIKRTRGERSGQPRHKILANYHYPDWLRGPLRPVVEAVLLDPRTLSRPYFRQETIRRWVSEHMAGQDNTDRLSTLLSLELTLRNLIEG